MAVKIVQNNQTSDAQTDINDNLAAIAGNAIRGFDPSDGSFKSEFGVGDISENSAVGDAIVREGNSIKLVNTSGVIQKEQLWQDLVGASNLTGFILPYAAATPPAGWLVCDGTSKLVASFPALHAAIGYTYGGSAANFNLPDLRGEFIRGFDNGAGNDPDSAGRTNRGDGTTGDNVGTKQLSRFQSHTHVAFGDNNGVGGGANPALTLLKGSSGGNNKVTGASGGNETRSRNIYMLYCIKT